MDYFHDNYLVCPDCCLRPICSVQYTFRIVLMSAKYLNCGITDDLSTSLIFKISLLTGQVVAFVSL